MATIAVVGLGMHGTPGIAAGVFSALAAGGINVVAIAQGSSELNISVVVEARQAAEAQRRIHAAFQLSRIAGGAVIQPERMEIVLLGFGQIGRTLATLIGQVRRPALSLKVAAVIDRSGFVFEPQGIGPRRLAALAAREAEGPRPRRGGARPRRRRRKRRSRTSRDTRSPGRCWWISPPTTPAPCSKRRSPTAWIWSSPTSCRSPGAARRASRSGRRRGRGGGGSCTRPPSAPGSRSSTPITSSPSRATGWSGSRGCSPARSGYVLTEVGDGVPVLPRRARGHAARLHRARSAGGSLRDGRGPQGADPRPAARLSRGAEPAGGRVAGAQVGPRAPAAPVPRAARRAGRRVEAAGGRRAGSRAASCATSRR